MDVLKITGGKRLRGTVAVSGSKNAALPIMAASILADGPVWLSNIPRLTDVSTLSLLLRQLGMSVSRMGEQSLRIETEDHKPVRAQASLVRRMRASFCVLGPLLARRGRALVPLPGGCHIGSRTVELHLHGLASLGADISIRRGWVIAKAKRLRGTTIDMAGVRGTTVTGTANVLSAAVLATGTTILQNAAREPEIVDLGNFLISIGARIEGLGEGTLRIRGVGSLGAGLRGVDPSSATAYRIIPDRIEAVTLLGAIAITGGTASVLGAKAAHIQSEILLLREAGHRIDVRRERIDIRGVGRHPISFTTRPYPGIATDLQAQFMALATIGKGSIVVRDRVFPERFRHVAELNRLGASIRMASGGAVVSGTGSLDGAIVTATDLRASAALVLAGLAARGVTIVRQVHHLDRGYHRLERKLQGLGADVWRLSDSVGVSRSSGAA